MTHLRHPDQNRTHCVCSHCQRAVVNGRVGALLVDYLASASLGVDEFTSTLILGDDDERPDRVGDE